ncbi:MAG: glycosyl transferase [Sulfurimonas sp. RIFOXYC2_FULL_36_7]|nr:MAG: glycosyl transferase [Sulfurimonas sp. RIFOXYC2_FULL_36_7]
MSLTISIITAVRNNKEFIEDAVRNVLEQTYPHIEYIVVDGNSTDGTLDIIKKYEGKVSKWISEPDSGIYEALNKGIKLVTGDVVGFLHSDDLFTSNVVIEKIAEKFLSWNIDAVYSDLVYVAKNDGDKIIRCWKAGEYKPSSLKFGWMPPHPTLFLKKEVYNNCGLFNTALRISADYDMMLRLLTYCGNKIGYINETLIKMRLGGTSNRSLSNIITKSREDYVALKNNRFRVPLFTLILKNIRKLNQFF